MRSVTSASSSRAVTATAFATPAALALPWLFTTMPLRPRKTAPLWLLGSRWCLSSSVAGREIKNPILDRNELEKPRRSRSATNRAVPSTAFKATLPENPSAWNICLRSLVCGIGFGCFQSPNNREMLANVARENASYASGVLSIVRTFGQCLGAAVVGVWLAATTGSDQAVHFALWTGVVASAGSVLFSLSRLRPAVRASA